MKQLICLFLPLALTAQSGLQIQSGAQLVCNGSVYIVLNDADFVNDGAVAPGEASLKFTGSAASHLTVNELTDIYHLEIAKTAANVQLGGSTDLKIFHNLQMSGGIFDLANNAVYLPSGAVILGETETNRITSGPNGYIEARELLNAPSAANPGNLGAVITSAVNMGITTVRRGHKQTVTPTGSSIFRYYDIKPANNSGLDATLTFFYWDAELDSHDELHLTLWRSADGGTSWTNEGRSGWDIFTNYITLDGIPAFSIWTSADPSAPLPVELIDFQAKKQSRTVLCTWQTATEKDMDFYEIEHSANGFSFQTAGKIAAVGLSAGPQSYEWTDFDPVAGGNYYRLKMVEQNGLFTYSPIRLVHFGEGRSVAFFPNPASDFLYLQFTGFSEEENVEIEMFDATGRQVLQRSGKIPAADSNLRLSLTKFQLPAGIYALRVIAESGEFFSKEVAITSGK
jgi:hypothetical protein